MEAWNYNSSLHARRRESRPRAVLAKLFEDDFVGFRRNVRDILFIDRLPTERRRFDGERLGCRSLFADKVGWWHRSLFNWEKWHTRKPIEEEGITRLGDLRDRFSLAPLVSDRDYIGAGWQIMVP